MIADPTAHAAALRDLALRRRGAALAVPTDDTRVRALLRALGEPVTLFGERRGDRRSRLRSRLAVAADSPIPLPIADVVDDTESDSDTDKEHVAPEFFTRGGIKLHAIRARCAKDSISRAKVRIAIQHWLPTAMPRLSRRTHLQGILTQLQHVDHAAVVVADTRPLSACRFAPGPNAIVAAGSWTGAIRLWNADGSALGENPAAVLHPHADRVSDITWSSNVSSGALVAASCAVDGSVLVHCQQHADLSATDAFVASAMPTHPTRVARTRFLPWSGALVTTCSDGLWRLIDVEHQTVLLEQDGHRRETFALSVHPDGSLVATGGRDAVCLLWDLRSGRRIAALQGHARQVLAADFHSNGFHIATGSEDNTVRVWDLRQAQCAHMLTGHTNMVSDVRFLHYSTASLLADKYIATSDAPSSRETLDTWISEQVGGTVAIDDLMIDSSVLLTGSYDGTCRLWASGNYSLFKTISGLGAKVMSCDISPDGSRIVAACYDRTLKLFAALD